MENSALLIERGNRNISENTITRYMEIRNISGPSTKTDNMVNLYAFYILDLALRISLLEMIGNPLDDKIKEYLLDFNLDWIRLEKHLSSSDEIGVKNLVFMRVTSKFV